MEAAAASSYVVRKDDNAVAAGPRFDLHGPHALVLVRIENGRIA